MTTVAPIRRRGLALGALVGLFGEGLALPIGLVSAALLTRHLGLAQYGLLGVVFAAISPAAWVAASVIGGRSAVRLISTADVPLEAAAGVLRLNFWIGAGGWAAFCLISPLLAGWLSRPGSAGLLMFAGAEILLFPIARAHRDTLVALGRYSSAGAAAALHNTIRLLVVIGAVLAGLGVDGVVLALIVARLAEIGWCRSVEAPPLRLLSPIRYEGHGEFLSTIFLYALCIQLFNRIDILVLTALGGGNKAVSEYAAAQALAMGPGLFAMVVSALMIAAITRAEAAGDMAEAQRVRGHCDQIAALAAGGTLALAGASPSLSTVLFGAKFAGAAPLLTLLLIGGAGAILLSMSTAQMIVAGRHRILLFIGAPMLAAAVAGHLVAIPIWGASGAAAITASVAVTAGMAAVFSLVPPRSARLVRLAKALACGGCGFVIARALGSLGLPLVDAAAGALGAFGLMYVSGAFTLADIRGFADDLKPPAAARVRA